tara:strand:- start:46295 stop:46615 length:321 start_codon:yes stop_codon:yes gene_type:complete
MLLTIEQDTSQPFIYTEDKHVLELITNYIRTQGDDIIEYDLDEVPGVYLTGGSGIYKNGNFCNFLDTVGITYLKLWGKGLYGPLAFYNESKEKYRDHKLKQEDNNG